MERGFCQTCNLASLTPQFPLRCLDLDEEASLPEALAVGTVPYHEWKKAEKIHGISSRGCDENHFLDINS